MTLTGHWTPVGLSASIEPATSTGTHIDGKELVVWRDNSGVAHVWEDRCPHRGMRLSFGFVRGDHIACLYHGWQYDTSGQCQYIPAHPQLEVPKTIKVPRYKTMEAGGMIWTHLADGDAEALPALPEHVSPVRSLYLDCAVVDALLVIARTGKVTTLADNLVKVELETDTLLVGLQNLTANRMALHFAISGQAAPVSQIRVLAWITALRFAIEHPLKSATAPSLSPVREAL